MKTSTSKPKYRPVLSDYLIAHILELAHGEKPSLSGYSIELIGILAPFKAKIDNLSKFPVYTTEEKVSIEESLGMVEPATAIPKEEYWQRCYQLWVSNPTDCNLRERAAAREHMYLNNLMAPEEVEEFEKEVSLVQTQAD